jgi:ATP-dependent protease ClpP protease subunit
LIFVSSCTNSPAGVDVWMCSRGLFVVFRQVPAVTELIIAELLILQHQDRNKPIYLYINSTGTTRADGETVGFETEGTVRISDGTATRLVDFPADVGTLGSHSH